MIRKSHPAALLITILQATLWSNPILVDKEYKSFYDSQTRSAVAVVLLKLQPGLGDPIRCGNFQGR
jgi:hypothetical protein